MKEKQTYETPEMKLSRFNTEDVLASSTELGGHEFSFDWGGDW